ncbi:MAG: cytochrome c biogenesis protein CcsA [Thermoplasmata archaeon]|nr:cytochrome c biogenesis protein CcsA [Thermoplasmata archaeon]
MIYSRLITLTLFFLITGIVVYYYYIFMTSDMTYYYVWQYSSVDLEAKYKFSAVLAGLAGSLLFWVWWIIIPWFIEEVRAMGRKIDSDTLDIARLATFGVMAVLIYVLSLYELFALTPQNALDSSPDGNGLNDLLTTDLMIIHPPVVFVAYGAMVIPFAAAFAYLLTGHKDWTRLSVFWGRFGWLMLTAGIGIGALWAYTVLGWGGYWAWDPIETSSLLPWFLLTAFLHAQLMYTRKGDYPILAPLLGVTSFILVVFATFATRAAGLWLSVHSYGDADLSMTPWERFTEIMDTIPSVRVYMWFMVIAFVITLIVIFRVYAKKRKDAEEEERYYTLAELIEDDMLMFATIIMLVLTTIVTFFILMSGMDGLGPEDFDRPIGFLAMIGVLLLFVCLVWRDLGRMRVAQIAGATALAAVCAALIFRDNMAVAATFPILIVGLVGAVYKTGKSFNRKRLWPSLKLVSAHLIHVSVVLIILGYIGSSYLREETILSLEVDGASQEFEGYTFRSTDLRISPNSGWTEIEVWRGDRHISTEELSYTVSNGEMRSSEIAVVWTIQEDIYLIQGLSDPSAINYASVSVTILPFMNALWLGMYLMMFGIAARIFTEFMVRRKRAQKVSAEEDIVDLDDEPEEDDSDYDEDGDYYYDGEDEEEEEDSTTEEEEHDDSYYEDLLEEELKRI